MQRAYSTVMKLIGPSRNLLQRGIINPIRELKLSETEFGALCLHLLWLQPGPDVLTPETQQVLKESRREVFADLHNYYVNSLGMETYATRIADFMALMSALEKNVFQQKENIIMANVFTTGVIDPKVVTLTR
uniref:NR LBD domain-containing protein n=1 Tax=Panagrolaimus sp. JU765 TaxID=591449 RepID=A0AC34R0N8_9BILA